MSELLEKVRAKAAAAESAAQADYESLVQAAAANEDIDPDEVIDLLAKFKRTPNQLATDVAAYRRQCELRALVDAVPGLTAQRNAISAKIAELVSQRNAEVARFDAQIRSLEFEAAGLLEHIMAGDAARNTLAAERTKSRR